MCNPVLLAVASTAITVAGQQQQAQASQKLSDVNAAMARTQAADTIQRGAVEEERHRSKVKQLIGSQSAAMGASGVQSGTGSFATLQDQTAGMGELDAMTIRANALRKAWGYESQAGVDTFEGKQKRTAADANSFGTILGGAAQAYGAYKAK